MENKTTTTDLLLFIQRSLELLATDERTLYSRAAVSRKLRASGAMASSSLLSNIMNGKGAKRKTLVGLTEAMVALLTVELGVAYDWSAGSFSAGQLPDWKPGKIIEQAPAKTGYHFHALGRWTLQKKTSFIGKADREVTIIGLAMRTFLAYFHARADHQFADYIEALLARGIDINCYLLHPGGKRARTYFEDIGEMYPDERHGERKIENILRGLMAVSQGYAEAGLPGRMRIFTYDHLPTAHFLIVDGDRPDGRLAVSHYLYGQPPAKSPVLEVWRKDDRRLYDLYYDSAKSLMRGARRWQDS